MPDEEELSIETAVRENLTQTLRDAARQIEAKANEAAFRSLSSASNTEQGRALILRGWSIAMQAVVNELDAIYTAADMGDETQVRRIASDAERLIQQADRSVQHLQQLS